MILNNIYKGRGTRAHEWLKPKPNCIANFIPAYYLSFILHFFSRYFSLPLQILGALLKYALQFPACFVLDKNTICAACLSQVIRVVRCMVRLRNHRFLQWSLHCRLSCEAPSELHEISKTDIHAVLGEVFCFGFALLPPGVLNHFESIVKVCFLPA